MSEAIVLPTPAVPANDRRRRWPAADPLCIRDYASLIRCLRQRMHDLGLTQLDVDELSGLPSGYTGKLMSRPEARNFRALGPLSLPLLMSVLGVYLRLEPLDDTARSVPVEMAGPTTFGDIVGQECAA